MLYISIHRSWFLGLREMWGEYNINKWGGDAHLDDARRDEPPGVISAPK